MLRVFIISEETYVLSREYPDWVEYVRFSDGKLLTSPTLIGREIFRLPARSMVPHVRPISRRTTEDFIDLQARRAGYLLECSQKKVRARKIDKSPGGQGGPRAPSRTKADKNLASIDKLFALMDAKKE